MVLLSIFVIVETKALVVLVVVVVVVVVLIAAVLLVVVILIFGDVVVELLMISCSTMRGENWLFEEEFSALYTQKNTCQPIGRKAKQELRRLIYLTISLMSSTIDVNDK